MQVLVVDDDGYTRAVLREILEDEGYSVLSAPDGQTALAVLGRVEPLVALLDQRMPGMSGSEVVAAAPTGHQFLLLTAAPGDADGTVPVVAKPFDIETLLAAVTQAAARLDGQRVEARRAGTSWRRRSLQQKRGRARTPQPASGK